MVFKHKINKIQIERQNHIDKCNHCRDYNTYMGNPSCNGMKTLNGKENLFEWLSKALPLALGVEIVGILIFNLGVGNGFTLLLGVLPIAWWLPAVWDDVKDAFK